MLQALLITKPSNYYLGLGQLSHGVLCWLPFMILLMGNRFNPSRQAPLGPRSNIRAHWDVGVFSLFPGESHTQVAAWLPHLEKALGGTLACLGQFSSHPPILNATVIAFSGTQKVEKTDRRENKCCSPSIYLEMKVKRERGSALTG